VILLTGVAVFVQMVLRGSDGEDDIFDGVMMADTKLGERSVAVWA